MLITIIASNQNKREKDWLGYWRDEFERLGFEVVVNPDLTDLEQSDILVLLDDGRALSPETYAKLGYFYHLKKSENRTPARLSVALSEAIDFDNDLVKYFDHVTKTDKGLINTVKDYLYFVNNKKL
jgi:hypothetical protein